MRGDAFRWGEAWSSRSKGNTPAKCRYYYYKSKHRTCSLINKLYKLNQNINCVNIIPSILKNVPYVVAKNYKNVCHILWVSFVRKTWF